MKCPRCDIELLKGYVQVGNARLMWSPIAKKKNPYIRSISRIDLDEVQLGKYSFWAGSKALADRCDNCGLVVVYPEYPKKK